MRRLLFTGLFFCLMAGAFAQHNLTRVQKDFQNSIVSFLREEGYSPSIDDDGWIAFKKEGKSFWVIIEGESPFFATLKRSGFRVGGDDGYEFIGALWACNEVNEELRAVKMYCSQKSASIQVEQYTRSAEDFKYVFHKNMNVLELAAKKFVEEYNEFQENR